MTEQENDDLLIQVNA